AAPARAPAPPRSRDNAARDSRRRKPAASPRWKKCRERSGSRGRSPACASPGDGSRPGTLGDATRLISRESEARGPARGAPAAPSPNIRSTSEMSFDAYPGGASDARVALGAALVWLVLGGQL